MVRAIAPGRRARKDEDKEGRRQQLLEAAAKLHARVGYAQVKMADVAAEAGLAKGTVFIYFPTKEALFLALLEQELFGWLEGLAHALEHEGGRWTAARLARLIAETTAERDALTRLLLIWQNILEHNVTLEQVRPFKERLLAALLGHGTLLEKRLPFLRKGEGAQLLVHVNAVVTGLRQMAEVSPVVGEVLATPGFEPLRIDFHAELLRLLTHLLRGLEAR